MEKKARTVSLMSVLRQLLMHVDLTANGLAKILSVPTPTIHRLTTGDVRDPRLSTLTLLSDYFGVTIDQLAGRQILDPRFYLEIEGGTLKPAFSIPLFTFHEAGALHAHLKKPTHWFRWKSHCDDADIEKIFAIKIKNNLYEPLFSQETVIVINPTIQVENGDYVLVSFAGDNAPVLKRYISEGKNKYLCMVNNTDIKTEKHNPKESKIIGVVIEACKQFRN